MNIKNIFKNILNGILTGADIGAKAGLPIASQIDQVADVIKDAKGRSRADTEKIGQALAGLNELKSIAAEVKDKGAFESKRFRALLVGILVLLLTPHLGLPEEQLTQAVDYLVMLVMAYIGGQSLSDFAKAWKR